MHALYRASILQGPLAPVKSISDKQKVKAHLHYEYPLVFSSDRYVFVTSFTLRHTNMYLLL